MGQRNNSRDGVSLNSHKIRGYEEERGWKQAVMVKTTGGGVVE